MNWITDARWPSPGRPWTKWHAWSLILMDICYYTQWFVCWRSSGEVNTFCNDSQLIRLGNWNLNCAVDERILFSCTVVTEIDACWNQRKQGLDFYCTYTLYVFTLPLFDKKIKFLSVSSYLLAVWMILGNRFIPQKVNIF